MRQGASIVYWLPAIATAALIAVISHQPALPDVPGPFDLPDWAAHFLEYGFFTLTLVFATTDGFALEARTPARIAAAVAIASLYGITDEWHQSFVIDRQASVIDWAADTVGAVVMAVLIIAAWRRMAAPRQQV